MLMQYGKKVALGVDFEPNIAYSSALTDA